MRVESSVLSVSWIPSEAVTGLPKEIFELGVTHYDEPLPDEIRSMAELETLRTGARFRFANHLAAWIEVEDGRIVDAGYAGRGYMGITTVSLAGRKFRFEPVALPDVCRNPPVIDGGTASFVQTAGGRAPLPAPRRVRHPPFFQLKPPDVWTTLGLTLRADGSSTFELLGASEFPRHWLYDATGLLAAKAGLADFEDWWRTAFGKYTPWGKRDSKAYLTTVESALERRLATTIMRGGHKPEIRVVKKGRLLTEQGAPVDELYLLLDGVLRVEVDGAPLAEIGPGAILGERAILEEGRRTATLRALTKCRVAVARADQIDRAALTEVSRGHHREDAPREPPPAADG
jgi:Cyclic nucleotide-binding domain